LKTRTTSQVPRSPIARKAVTEYPLPVSAQTHEIVSPSEGLLVISQQPNSALVKMRVAPRTGAPVSAVQHTIDSPYAGLHGLSLSVTHPSHVWATLQFTSELLLLDPVADDLDAPPNIRLRVPLPPEVKGPHVVLEHGPDLWTSCKDSHHVVRVRADDPANVSIYPCGPRPIFVARHPTSGDIYASLDQSSAIFRVMLGRSGGQPETIPIPSSAGSTPVGLIAGPDGNVWFVLLGGSSGGTGTFGRIDKDGQITWFQMKTGAAMGAGLIHLGFAPSAAEAGSPARIYLLGSSMADRMGLNAVFQVGLSGDYARIEAQQTIAFPSQASMSHRVLVTSHGIYATELGACAVAHLWPAFSPFGEGINEMSDPYALWGCGVPSARVEY
jgi:virginiamycin B lyase